MKITSLFLVLIIFPLFFASCEADINLHNISDQVSLHPDLIFPIGGANITLGQIISNNDSLGNFEISQDAEINYVNFDNYEFKFPMINFLDKIQELDKNQYLSPTGVSFIPPNITLPLICNTDTIVLGTNSDKNGDRIDSLKITSATISVIVDVSEELKSIKPSDIQFSIAFPFGNIRMLDGSSSTMTFSPSGYGLVNTVVIKNFMMITSNNKTGIPVELKVRAKSGDCPLTLTPSSAINSRINFTQLDYSTAYGIFKSSFNIQNTIQQSIDYTQYLPFGSLKPANPQVCISAISNIGTYLNLKIDYIKAFLTTNQNLNPVFACFNGSKSTSIELNRKPVIPGDTIDFKLPTIDNNWGSTSQLFQGTYKPNMLQYNFSASVDSVLNNQLNTASFITSDPSIKVNIKTIVPLNFTKGSYYSYQDSIPNLFILISNALNQTPYNNITSTALILNVTNGLPVRTTFTFNLKDSLGNVIPTTFVKTYSINAGIVDNNGIVQPGKETKQTIQVSITKDQLTTLRKARTMSYSVLITGEDANSNIHFTKTNTFDVKVGLFVMGDVNTTIGTKTQN